ncbi:MAG: hypothetical protein AB9M60_08280 [Leptothrix sp. (in: b-proteobacteria)]
MSRWFPEVLQPWARALTLRVDGAASSTGSGDEPVESRLAALAAQLDRLAPRRGTRLSIVLGTELCRLRVLPWNAGLRNDAQRQRLAEHGFVQTHGEVARGWHVCLDAARHGQHSLSCAIDRGWVDGLAALAAARGLRLHSVTPALVGLHAALRARSDAWASTTPRWLVLAEARSITLLLCGADGVQQVRRVAMPAHPAGAAVARLLDRTWIALGIEGLRCPVCWIGPGLDVQASVPGWDVTRFALPQTAATALLVGEPLTGAPSVSGLPGAPAVIPSLPVADAVLPPAVATPA